MSAISGLVRQALASQQGRVSRVAAAMGEIQSTVNGGSQPSPDAMGAARQASTSAGNRVVRSAIGERHWFPAR